MYFEIFKSQANNQWYWHLKSDNHKIVAQGEGYINRQDCLHAIKLVANTSCYTPIYER